MAHDNENDFVPDPSRRKFMKGIVAAAAVTAFGGAAALFPREREKSDLEHIRKDMNGLSEVEKARNSGRIELKSENDWENYFTLISPDDARLLTEMTDTEAQTSGEFKILLPFDPRNAPNLIVEDIKSQNEEGTALSIKNIPSGTRIMSPLDGQFTIDNSHEDSTELSLQKEVKRRGGGGIGPVRVELLLDAVENVKMNIPKDLMKPFVAEGQVDMGMMLGTMQGDNGELVLESATRQIDDASPLEYSGSLRQLMTYNGKIAFVESPRFASPVGSIIF